jgi:hypothetical protein
MVALCLPSCARQEEVAEERAASSEVPSGAGEPAPPPAPAPVMEQARFAKAQDRSAASIPAAPVPVRPISRKLVRTVNLDVQVRATEQAASAVQAVAVQLGGYVGTVDAQRVEGVLHYRITLRVPVDQLDKALAEIRKLAVRVDREHQEVQDVTDQYVDLDARLRTLQATERELQALLAEARQRGQKVEDIMAVYQQLTEIRSQIEQIQGQLLSLEKLAALSTINLQITPVEAARPVTPEEGWQPSDTVRGSTRILLTLLRAAGDFAIFALIVLLPLGLLAALVVWLVKRLARRLPASPAAGTGQTPAAGI